ncbi:MAG: sulfatase-like hydrolase/transferase [Pseudomonadales bacterium]|nr:sulfatase-like hydrolase/transferase [Pseudomonadales bacterium]
MTKHVYLVSIDALRFDCVPYQQDKSFLKKHRVLKYLKIPTLEKLTKKSLNFELATTTAPYTSASHASLFTGLYPPRTNVRSFFNPSSSSLNKNLITLAEVFKSEGYKTVFATDEESVFKPLDLHRGFDYFFPINDDKLISFIKKNKNEKIFVFKHFLDVHNPYLYTRYSYKKDVNNDYEKFISKKINKKVKLKTNLNYYDSWRKVYGGKNNNIKSLFPLYVKGITKFDQGRFKYFIENLEKMGEFEESLFAFFADHGEGRTDKNGFFAHGGDLYDDAVRIPLFLIHKDIHKVKNDKRLVSLIDIFPTITNFVFGDDVFFYPKYNLDGIDLLNFTNTHRYTYSEVWKSNIINPLEYPDNKDWLLSERCIRTKNKKFILKGKPEVFLISNDDARFSQGDIGKYILTEFSNKGVNLSFKDGSLIQALKDAIRIFNDRMTKYYDLKKDRWEENPDNILRNNYGFKNKILVWYFIKAIYNIDKTILINDEAIAKLINDRLYNIIIRINMNEINLKNKFKDLLGKYLA